MTNPPMTDDSFFQLLVEPWNKSKYMLQVKANDTGRFDLTSVSGRYEKLILGSFQTFKGATEEAWRVKEREENGRLD